MPNTFGHFFRVTTFGESHGGAVGAVIDGCPPGIRLNADKIQEWLNRRRPGQSHLTSPRQEPDQIEILSGLENSSTLGTPICIMVRNRDQKSEHYSDLKSIYRPSHADFTTEMKYGIRAASGGGRASARETIGRVAGGAVAEQMLKAMIPELTVTAWVDSVASVQATINDHTKVTRKQVEKSPLRCPDSKAAKAMEQVILQAKDDGDSVGGTIRCVITGCPIGLGDPVFDKLEADFAKAMLSLPATKGFEVGIGFAATALRGSQHNDAFVSSGKKNAAIRTATNHSGGIQGGISNGEPILLRIAFKPVATIFKPQETVDSQKKRVLFKPQAGRHDPCVLPRAVPMVESMALIVLADHFLRQVAVRPAIYR